MQCPACKNEMTEQDFGAAMVDVCVDGCWGMWFDWKEIAQLDEEHEGVGDALEKALNAKPQKKHTNREPINCPKCKKPMKSHIYKDTQGVLVNECYICGGFFLDAGQLRAIRDSLKNRKDKEKGIDFSRALEKSSIVREFKQKTEKEKLRNKAINKYSAILRINVAEKLFLG